MRPTQAGRRITTRSPVSTPAERLPIRAEAFDAYRWALLLVVAATHDAEDRKFALSLDRLALYDFFTSHPFLIFDAETTVGRRLVREGLEPRSLTYAAAPDRLANRRQRIQADVNALVPRGLARVEASDGRLVLQLTAEGAERAASLSSLFVQAVRVSANFVIHELDRVADRTLRERAVDWTSHRALMVDILEPE